MREFFTKVIIPQSNNLLTYHDKILLLGSCFADNIGAKFQECYFQTTINPYGVLYNPASIANSIASCLTMEEMSDSNCELCNSPFRFVSHNGMWHSMEHHGDFSSTNQEEVLQRCLLSRKRLICALHEASTVIITFGTAWIYEMDGLVVANCHKMPASNFTRRCLSVEEIVSMWRPIIALLPNKQWIFTVSPIRHLKDGMHANHISKAILLQAIDTLIASTKGWNLTSRSSYFPSYEIMMDELRDYRFYAKDMVHPSDVAVEYIWERFVGTYMCEGVREEMRDLHQLWLDRHHRCLHPDSDEALAFAQRTENKLRELQQRYHWLN